MSNIINLGDLKRDHSELIVIGETDECAQKKKIAKVLSDVLPTSPPTTLSSSQKKEVPLEESRKYPKFSSKKIEAPFKVVTEVNSGSFGKILLINATSKTTKSPTTAIIKIPKGNELTIGLSRSALQNEIEILSKISEMGVEENFPIVNFLGTIEPAKGTIGMIVEKCHADLFYHLNNSREYISYTLTSKIAHQCIQALDFLENHLQPPLIHLDLKLDNILISSYDPFRIKLCDFGLSKSSPQPARKNPVGNLKSIAPEVALQNSFSTSADKWSLGCVLFRLRTRENIFTAKDLPNIIASMHDLVGPFSIDDLENSSVRDTVFLINDSNDHNVCLRDSFQLNKPIARHMKIHHGATIYDPTINNVRSSTESNDFINFINSLLKLDPSQRPSYEGMLQHPFIRNCL